MCITLASINRSLWQFRLIGLLWLLMVDVLNIFYNMGDDVLKMVVKTVVRFHVILKWKKTRKLD
jgi:hypothetical protein